MTQRSKFIALAEEETFDTWDDNDLMYFKLLSESIATTREDFYPETTDYWTAATYMNGFFRTSGSFDVLADPIQWPKLLVLFIGDGTSSGDANGYTHEFLFGANEDLTPGGTEIKPFSTVLGVGIDKDRKISGCVIESINLEASAMNPVRSTVNLVGSGNEALQSAKSQSVIETGWNVYTQPYLTFTSASTMTIGSTDRLTTSPTIESFNLTLERAWDTDHYVLGGKFMADGTLSGIANVTGTMDFTFDDQDEYERYLTSVDGAQAGDQAPFEVVLDLTGAVVGSNATTYGVKITIPRTRYENSNVNFSGRDRIVQTVDFRGIWDSSTDAACKIDVTNGTSDYTSLS